MFKICTKCKASKKLEAFSLDKSHKDGYKTRCKTCVGALTKEWKKKTNYNQNYYSKNKKELNKKSSEYQKKRRLENPLYRFKDNVRKAISRSFRRNGFSKHLKSSMVFGCTFEELQNHLKGTFEANYGIPFNWIEPSLLHIDHVVPLATAKTKEELLKLNHFSNLQYLLAEDNLEKGDSLEWVL